MRIRHAFFALAIAVAAHTAAAQDSIGWHVVKAGETLEGITARYLGSPAAWRENWKLNPDLKDPHRLVPGQRIRVIVGRELPARFAEVRKVARRVEKKPTPDPWEPARAGDRLAERHGLQTHEVASAELLFDDLSQLTLTERSLIFLRATRAAAPRRDRSEIEIVEGQGDLERPVRPARAHDIEIIVGTAVAKPPLSAARARFRNDSGQAARVMSYRGATSVAGAGRSVTVGEGMGVSVPPGGAPTDPEKLLAAPKIDALDVLVPRPVLRWPAVGKAAVYTVEVCRDRGCAEVVTRAAGVQATEWRAPEALPPGAMFWRITARSATGLDGYPAVAPLVVRAAISGIVRTGGKPSAGVSVALHRDGAPAARTATAADGSWVFGPLKPGQYQVAVDSRTIAPKEAWAEQVDGPAGALCGGERRTTPGGCAGGRRGGVGDDARDLESAEHVAVVDLHDAPVGDVDFGFSFDAVTSAADQGQGSLRQFLENANVVPGPNAMRFLPAIPAEAHGWVIHAATPLPALTDAGTTIDGAAHDPRDPSRLLGTQQGEIGSVTSVGARGEPLRNPSRPDLTIDLHGADVGIRAESPAALRNVGLVNARTHLRATGGLTIENAVIGVHLSRAGSAVGVEILGPATMRRVLVTAMASIGIAVRPGGRLDAEDVEVSDCGWSESQGQGILLESDGSRITRSLLLQNTSATGLGIAGGRGNTVEETTFRGNRLAFASSVAAGQNDLRGNRFEGNSVAAAISGGSGGVLPAPQIARIRIDEEGARWASGHAGPASRVELFTSGEDGAFSSLAAADVRADGTFDAPIDAPPRTSP